MPIDPVCGIELEQDIAINYVHQGRHYYFCCEGCKGIFLRKPRKYVKSKELSP
jgi:YHS domain-containing protein